MLQSKSNSLNKKLQTNGHTYTGQKHALVYFTNINMEDKKHLNIKENIY